MITTQQKAAWLEALRSGHFKQTFGRMGVTKNGQTSYCAIGVFMALMGQLTKNIPRDSDGKVIQKPADWEYSWNMSPSFKLYEFHDGNFRSYFRTFEPNVIMNMNDAQRMKFPQIADWIEKNIHPEE